MLKIKSCLTVTRNACSNQIISIEILDDVLPSSKELVSLITNQVPILSALDSILMLWA